MTEFKPPWVEDYEDCHEHNVHRFIKFDDGTLLCYYCGIDFKEFRKKEMNKEK